MYWEFWLIFVSLVVAMVRFPSSLTKQQFKFLVDKVPPVRDRAIIVLFAESGLRLSDLANVG